MSGSNEERPAAADEVVSPEAETDAAPPEAETSVEPAVAPQPEAEMTAAEALARATEAAAATGPRSAGEAGSDDDDGAESSSAQTDSDEGSGTPSEAEPAAETGAVSEAAAEPAAEMGDVGEAAAAPAAKTGDASEAVAAPATAATVGDETAAEPSAATSAAAEPAADRSATTGDEQPAEPDATPQPAKKAKKTKKTKKAKPAAAELPDRPELRPVREALADRRPLEGRVIGWNNGGFHLALGELPAFCPRSEMEVGEVQEPESYLDRTFMFRVLRLQGKGRRIVVSRAAHLRAELSRQRNELRRRLKVGNELDGTVASLTDFGAFVDLGGAQGLVHVSEISHRRVEHPSQALSEGQAVRVKVLKVEQGGRRISLSMRALEPDPWKDLADRFPRGAVVKGKVERANQIGAFIELAPGLTGLLPARSMSIPRETNPARAYPPGKEVSVQIVSVDPRRQRIALALEGSGIEGTRTDYQEYKRQSRQGSAGEGFNALASAFRRLQDDAE